MAAAAVAMDSVRDSASGSAQDSGSRTVSRTVFTEEEVDILRKAYEEGLKGTGAVHSAQLQELSARINKPISVIKNWIGNQNRKRSTRERNSDPKPSQKLRKISSYNVFTQEFMKSDEGKQIDQLSEKNKVIARKWRELPEEEKAKYKSVSTVPNVPVEPWKEAQKIFKNFTANCDWCQHCGLECFYIITHKSNSYVGGTAVGKEFLRGNPMIAGNFLSFCQKDTQSTVPPNDGLRKAVQAILNLKYALAVGNPKARVPYSSIESDNIVIENFPEGLKFGPPSSFGNASLQKIIDCADKITFKISHS